MVIFHSYVSLPEGIQCQKCELRCFTSFFMFCLCTSRFFVSKEISIVAGVSQLRRPLDDHEKAITSTAHVGCRDSSKVVLLQSPSWTWLLLWNWGWFVPFHHWKPVPQNTKCVATPQQLDTLWYSNVAVGCRLLHGRRGLDIWPRICTVGSLALPFNSWQNKGL